MGNDKRVRVKGRVKGVANGRGNGRVKGGKRLDFVNL